MRFYELAKKNHPDTIQGEACVRQEEKFKKISAAYDILSNEALKRDYDAARDLNQNSAVKCTYAPYNGGFNYKYNANAQQTYSYDQKSKGFKGRTTSQ